MNNFNFDNLDAKSLRIILKKLKEYRNLRKKVWKRWYNMFLNILNKKDVFKVEFCSLITKEEAYQFAFWVYKKFFGKEPKIDEIEFIEKKELKAWILVIFNDKMVDMSFLRLQKKFNV